MEEIGADTIANSNEGRSLLTQGFKSTQTPFLKQQIDNTLEAIYNFADNMNIMSGNN